MNWRLCEHCGEFTLYWAETRDDDQVVFEGCWDCADALHADPATSDLDRLRGPWPTAAIDELHREST
jgi:hypothetical protein